MFDFFRSGQKKTETEEPQKEHQETAAVTPEEDTGEHADAEAMLDLEEIRLNEEELQNEAEAQYEKQEVFLAEKHRNATENKSVRKGGKAGAAAKEQAKTTTERKVLGNTFVICFIAAVLINLFTETIARQAQFPSGGFVYLVEQPLVFLANTLIIYATLTIAALFKRRAFVMALVSSVWILIAISNGVILLQRMTPFNMKDMTAFADGITLITNYFSVPQLIGLAVGSVAAVGSLTGRSVG